MQSQSAGTAIVDTLEALEIDRVFGIPGYHILDVYDRLGRSPIEHVLCSNEEGTVRAAGGHARITREPAVAIVSAGPGAINAMSGIGEAYSLSIPMVVVAGAEPRRDGPHGIDDPRATQRMNESIAKRLISVDDPREAPESVVEAYRTATAGRPGPVVVQVPMDVMKYETPMPSVSDVDVPPLRADEAALDTIAERLDAASRPAVVVGQGSVRAGAAEAIHELAETLDAPVVVTERGLTGYVERPRYAGGFSEGLDHPAARDVFDEADLCLGVGVRERIRRYFADVIDVERHYLVARIERYHLGTSAAFGDLSASVRRLTDACSPTEGDWWKQPVETGWKRHWEQLEREIANKSDPIEQLPQGGPDPATKIDDVNLIHPAAIIDCLNDQLHGDEIVAGDVGVHLQYAMKYLDLETPNSFLTPESWGGMGHAIPSMIGAKFAAPDRRVLGVVGDGSFQMNVSAFFTAARHDLDITIVLFNNRQHNAITGDQMDQYGATGFTYVDEFDFASLADTVGGIGVSVETPAQLSEKLATAIEADGPTIIDIPTEPNII